MILELQNVTIGHTSGQMDPIEGIFLSLKQKELWLLQGPNGSGKTTLLRTMLGLHPPLGGEVRRHYRRASYVTQKVFVQSFMPMSVESFVALDFIHPRWFLRRESRREKKEKIQKVLEEVGLGGKQEMLIHQLSGGQWQRVRVARALIQNPDFLVLDEPTGFMDRTGRKEFSHLLLRLSRSTSTTVVLTSHHPIEEFGGLLQGVMEIENGAFRIPLMPE